MEAYRDRTKFWKHVVSIPFIYLPIISFVILDILVELYHRVCFPLYDIEQVNRRVYIKIDHQKLSYLNWVQKLNCMYCGYGNGLLRYACEIGARTEQYWCGVKHKVEGEYKQPEYQKEFLEYGNQKQFEEFMKK